MGKVLRRRCGRDVGSGAAWTVPCDVRSPVPAAGGNRPRDVISTRPTAGMPSVLDSLERYPDVSVPSAVPLGGFGCPGACATRDEDDGVVAVRVLTVVRGPGARGALRYRRPRRGAPRTRPVRRSRRRAEHGVPARPRRRARCLVRPTPGAVASRGPPRSRRPWWPLRARPGSTGIDGDLARRVTVCSAERTAAAVPFSQDGYSAICCTRPTGVSP